MAIDIEAPAAFIENFVTARYLQPRAQRRAIQLHDLETAREDARRLKMMEEAAILQEELAARFAPMQTQREIDRIKTLGPIETGQYKDRLTAQNEVQLAGKKDEYDWMRTLPPSPTEQKGMLAEILDSLDKQGVEVPPEVYNGLIDLAQGKTPNWNEINNVINPPPPAEGMPIVEESAPAEISIEPEKRQLPPSPSELVTEDFYGIKKLPTAESLVAAMLSDWQKTHPGQRPSQKQKDSWNKQANITIDNLRQENLYNLSVGKAAEERDIKRIKGQRDTTVYETGETPGERRLRLEKEAKEKSEKRKFKSNNPEIQRMHENEGYYKEAQQALTEMQKIPVVEAAVTTQANTLESIMAAKAKGKEKKIDPKMIAKGSEEWSRLRRYGLISEGTGDVPRSSIPKLKSDLGYMVFPSRKTGYGKAPKGGKKSVKTNIPSDELSNMGAWKSGGYSFQDYIKAQGKSAIPTNRANEYKAAWDNL